MSDLARVADRVVSHVWACVSQDGREEEQVNAPLQFRQSEKVGGGGFSFIRNLLATDPKDGVYTCCPGNSTLVEIRTRFHFPVA